MCLESTTLPEAWRPVVGFEGIYEVSNLGRVKRVKAGKRTRIGRVLTPRPASGYYHVALYRSGTRFDIKVHVLVALAFVSGHSDGLEVNHMNGLKTDNRAANLEWVTTAANAKHAFRTGLKSNLGERNPSAKLTAKQVAYIRAMRGIVSQDTLAKQLGVTTVRISQIQLGKGWKHLHESARSIL